MRAYPSAGSEKTNPAAVIRVPIGFQRDSRHPAMASHGLHNTAWVTGFVRREDHVYRGAQLSCWCDGN
jgi:hypothetical protein